MYAADLPAKLPHQVYVWQRAWIAPVSEAVQQHATNFSEVVVLAAEVGWKGKRPDVTKVVVDYAVLARTKVPVGLALRVGNHLVDQETAQFLADLAASLVAEARTNDVAPVELQIDFDCPTSKLDSYREWLEVLQKRLAPLPVTITALPAWLDSLAFVRLATRATNYVLQVHSLEKPADTNSPLVLCDPTVARRAVERAGRLGVPFRVALPTYGYAVAFDKNGRFKGISGDLEPSTWPAGTQVRELRAEPLELAGLVREWSSERPAGLTAVIWYRLPTIVDNLNWHWPTLAAIVELRRPQVRFSAAARRVETGLVEISLVNNGELDISSRFAVEARWSSAHLLTGDGLRGFEMAERSATAAKFQITSSVRLPAGSTQIVGWLRFDQDCEVQLEVKKY